MKPWRLRLSLDSAGHLQLTLCEPRKEIDMIIQHPSEEFMTYYGDLPGRIESALQAALNANDEASYLFIIDGVKRAMAKAREEIKSKMLAQGGVPPSCNCTGWQN